MPERIRVFPKKIGVVSKPDAPEAVPVLKEVVSWLHERGIEVWQGGHAQGRVSLESMPRLDLLLVLGGDGTIISVARRILGHNVPIVGINFGRVGFLAELTTTTWQKALETGLSQGILLEKRMTLHYRLERGGTVLQEGEVINDAVITRGTCARLVRLDLLLDGSPIMCLRSDGLIMSTPTGSTGYCCSAGGSLLTPGMNAFAVAAICPFLNAFSPLVLDADSCFDVHLDDPGLDVFLTLDGQETLPLRVGDRLRVTGKPGRILFAATGTENYVDKLRRSGFIGSLGAR